MNHSVMAQNEHSTKYCKFIFLNKLQKYSFTSTIAQVRNIKGCKFLMNRAVVYVPHTEVMAPLQLYFHLHVVFTGWGGRHAPFQGNTAPSVQLHTDSESSTSTSVQALLCKEVYLRMKQVHTFSEWIKLHQQSPMLSVYMSVCQLLRAGKRIVTNNTDRILIKAKPQLQALWHTAHIFQSASHNHFNKHSWYFRVSNLKIQELRKKYYRAVTGIFYPTASHKAETLMAYYQTFNFLTTPVTPSKAFLHTFCASYTSTWL